MKTLWLTHRLVHWGWAALLGLALAVLIALAGQAPPAQASLYWATVNGAPDITKGVQSATPTFCFVGNAVTARPQRVIQVVQYLREFEYVGNVKFMAPSGNSLDYEIGPGGNLNNLQCPAPTTQTLPNGSTGAYYSSDIRLVLPATNVDATTPVPGLGCMTDKLKSAPSCVARDGSHIDCFARGVDDSTWDKHWDSVNGWGGWGQALGGTTNAPPAVASLSSTNLEVVAKGVGDSNLYITTWNGNTQTWSGWSAIPGVNGNATSGAACVGHDSHHLTCAVRWWNNYIYVADRDSGAWGSWVQTNLITPVGNGPSITSWGSGRLDLFARGLIQGNGEAALTHVWSTNYGVAGSWTGVEDLGVNIIGAPACSGYGTGGGDGRIRCFARGGDGNIWRRYYLGSSTWEAGWTSLSVPATSDPAVAARSTTTLDVFAAGPDGALWQTTNTSVALAPDPAPGPVDDPDQVSPNSGAAWGAWTNLGENNGWGSWSNAPWVRDDPYMRACQYNLKIGDNPWCAAGQFWPNCSDPSLIPYLNHTLHEVGHALGLAHEFVRADATTVLPTCTEAGFGGGVTQGWISANYDPKSVMNYVFATCGITANYDYTGLSALDKLAVHILYPPAGYPAEISGNLGIKAGQSLVLTSAWKAWGANMSFVASNFSWKVDSVVRSTTPDLSLAGLAAGNHTLSLDYDDFLGRHYHSLWTVIVLSPAAVTNAAVEGGALTPLFTPDYMIDIPIVR